MRQSRQRRQRSERGAAAVEFALVMIPLLLVIGGIVNFGVAFANQLSLDNAVRQAARADVVDVTGGPTAETIINDEYRPIGVDRTVDVLFPGLDSCEGSDFGDSIAIRGEVMTEFLFPWPVPDAVIADEVELNSEAEFQCEYS